MSVKIVSSRIKASQKSEELPEGTYAAFLLPTSPEQVMACSMGVRVKARGRPLIRLDGLNDPRGAGIWAQTKQFLAVTPHEVGSPWIVDWAQPETPLEVPSKIATVSQLVALAPQKSSGDNHPSPGHWFLALGADGKLEAWGPFVSGSRMGSSPAASLLLSSEIRTTRQSSQRLFSAGLRGVFFGRDGRPVRIESTGEEVITVFPKISSIEKKSENLTEGADSKLDVGPFAISRSGKFGVSVSKSTAVTLWVLDSMMQVASWQAPSRVTAIAVSDRGDAAIGDDQGEVRLLQNT